MFMACRDFTHPHSHKVYVTFLLRTKKNLSPEDAYVQRVEEH